MLILFWWFMAAPGQSQTTWRRPISTACAATPWRRAGACWNAVATALDAVEEAVVVMEDDETFDAGRGSFLNRDGKVQLDALIMDGQPCAPAVSDASSICAIRSGRRARF